MKKNKIFSLLAAASLLIAVPSCTNLDERMKHSQYSMNIHVSSH